MKLVFILLAFVGVTLGVTAREEVSFCQYYNDPHLIPFQDSPGAFQGQYFCRANCTEIMVKNEFLEIFVTPDPQGQYPIVEVSYFIFDHLSSSLVCFF